ncbi:hypothetical protein [Collinsella sp. AF08-23]|uniref:hypothetical protein n=1 Tax=Collinsella sp. AF08-23 TaxID=2292211 RepID=UPI000FF6A00F|nr:hypothetical protein [Collinsella sp. AF08-23]RHS39301.1 hypothetical protein DWV48_06640 [Collinsella sp. AF08-23]
MSRASEIALTLLAVGLGAVVGFIVVMRPESIERMKNGVTDIFSTSKKKVDEMSEEVALRTARLTKNPQVNQDWVERQWESIGY